jgi:hypothetical protein
MPVSRPLFAQAITGYTADEFRTLLDAAFPSPGVLRGGLAVAQNSPVGMTVLVAPGFCVVPAKSAANGKYLGEVTSTHTVTIVAAESNPRIDLIVMQSTDTAFADASDACTPIAVKGTANVSPVAPALPAGSTLLATVAVGALVSTIVSANITDSRASADEGVFATAAARDAAITKPVAGQTVYLVTPGIWTAYRAGAWAMVKVDDGTDQQTIIFTGTGDTPGAGSATWLALGNATVPAWATKCVAVLTLNGIYDTGTTSSVSATLKVGTAAGTAHRILAPGVAGQRFHLPINDRITGLAPGVQAVTVLGIFSAGTVVRCDATSFATLQLTYLA